MKDPNLPSADPAANSPIFSAIPMTKVRGSRKKLGGRKNSGKKQPCCFAI